MNQILLADNRSTELEIWIPPESGRVMRFASRELASYLHKMCGAEFPVVTEPSRKKTIRLKAGSEKSSGKDRFELNIAENGITIDASSPRAALYGVYELLETAGCAFVEPGIETVPFRSRLELPVLRKTQEAAFELRNIFREQIIPDKHAVYRGLEPGHHLPQIDWMAKRKLNHYNFYIDYDRYDLWEKHKSSILDALLDRGFRLEVCHHSIGYFFPPDEPHDYGNFGPATYYAMHPGWYKDGQVRIELPEVRKILCERYLAYVKRNPELNMIGLWPGDSSMPPPSPEMNVADGYLDFWNELAAALASDFPDKRLSIIAYIDLLSPPKTLHGADNEQIWFCPIGTNYHYSMLDLPYNAKFLDDMAGWIRKMPPGRVNVFDYFGWQPPLLPLSRLVQRTLSAYRSLGAGGAYGWCGFTYNLMGADYRWAKELYAYANMLWNPDCDIEAQEQIWAHGVFGAAAPEILEFFNILRVEHEHLAEEGLASMKPWIPLSLFKQLAPVLAGARKNAGDEQAVRRIDLLEQLAANAVCSRIYSDKRGMPSLLDSL